MLKPADNEFIESWRPKSPNTIEAMVQSCPETVLRPRKAV